MIKTIPLYCCQNYKQMALVLVTGGAGFIGYHLHLQLLNKHKVVAFDLLNHTNTVKKLRLNNLPKIDDLSIQHPFLTNYNNKPDVVVHLAAETGIAASQSNPEKYFTTNVSGTLNVLEQCRKHGVKNLIYASSSSVYSPNQSIMHEDADTSSQLSFYGTTKKMCETLVSNYCKQHGISAIGLRFFTVYGSYTRTDMAAYKFMTSIQHNEPITLYNNGNVHRDFTHVSDITTSIEKLIAKIIDEEVGSHQIFNIGFGSPVSIGEYAELIAEQLNKPLLITNQTLPANELVSTHSDTAKLQSYLGYKPQCDIKNGIIEMTNWFKSLT